MSHHQSGNLFHPLPKTTQSGDDSVQLTKTPTSIIHQNSLVSFDWVFWYATHYHMMWPIFSTYCCSVESFPVFQTFRCSFSFNQIHPNAPNSSNFFFGISNTYVCILFTTDTDVHVTDEMSEAEDPSISLESLVKCSHTCGNSHTIFYD